MLVLTRRTNDAILIGDDIRILVVRLGHGAVRLGITAPKDKAIVREELVEKTNQKENPMQKSDNSGGVVQVIQPTEDERLLSYQLPGGIVGQPEGQNEVCAMPAGRYTETRAPHTGVVWLEDTSGKAWRVRSDDIAPYALDHEAHTARQVARRKACDRQRALDWCERLLDLCDQWPGIIDHLPCDDPKAETIGELVDKLAERVRGVKLPNTSNHTGS